MGQEGVRAGQRPTVRKHLEAELEELESLWVATHPGGSDISIPTARHCLSLPTTKTFSLISRPPGYRGPRGRLLPKGPEPLLGSLTCLHPPPIFFQDL
ncbi:hypothetical protein EYF80_021153 [Liparis tanakae]|uniref:Uncharacterized protein n=1 Tax=Liparis tanakae TaxID=230148 RepID=A0A4Z2HS21_9TELE|nr:hypothetical protein EYF80_021153 [Liparis tanakae]